MKALLVISFLLAGGAILAGLMLSAMGVPQYDILWTLPMVTLVLILLVWGAYLLNAKIKRAKDHRNEN